jgi:hypothetical protein
MEIKVLSFNVEKYKNYNGQIPKEDLTWSYFYSPSYIRINEFNKIIEYNVGDHLINRFFETENDIIFQEEFILEEKHIYYYSFKSMICDSKMSNKNIFSKWEAAKFIKRYLKLKEL